MTTLKVLSSDPSPFHCKFLYSSNQVEEYCFNCQREPVGFLSFVFENLSQEVYHFQHICDEAVYSIHAGFLEQQCIPFSHWNKGTSCISDAGRQHTHALVLSDSVQHALQHITVKGKLTLSSFSVDWHIRMFIVRMFHSFIQKMIESLP